MDQQELISGLIETYRVLNTHVREDESGSIGSARRGSGPVREAVKQMRDNELHFSQSLKAQVTGVPVARAAAGDAAPTIGTETEQDSTAMLIAQFGTARETTLAMLRDLPTEAWDREEHGASIRSQVINLLQNDRAQLERINQQLVA